MSNSGIGFSGVLFFIFLTLKLCDIISWSWWWVTAPLWIPILLVVVGFIIIVTIDYSKEIKQKSKSKRFK